MITNIFFTCEFGSTLYGSKTPTSDTDFKSLYLPSDYDIIMGTVQSTISNSSKISSDLKNTNEDVDHEVISLKKFFDMLSCGDMIATEILFIPKQNIIKTSSNYEFIIENKSKLLNRKVEGFIGYMRKQAAKYAIKGSRVACVREALELIRDLDCLKVGDLEHSINNFVETHEFSSIVEISQPSGLILKHWEVCDRKIPFTISMKEARNILQKIFDNYGQRALQAEKNEGVDFKAVTHAIRVGQQTEELLTTGNITFPRPNAKELVKMKQAFYPYKQLAEILENYLDKLEELTKTSTVLPQDCDHKFMNNYVYETYRKQILN